MKRFIKKFVVLVAILVTAAKVASTGQPFVKEGVKLASGSAYGEALLGPDQQVINGTPNDHLRAFQKFWPELDLDDDSELINRTNDWSIGPCSDGDYETATLEEGGAIGTMTRTNRSGERCFFDQLVPNEPIASADCGNPFRLKRPAGPLPVPRQATEVVQAPEDGFASIDWPELPMPDYGMAFKDMPDESWRGQNQRTWREGLRAGGDFAGHVANGVLIGPLGLAKIKIRGGNANVNVRNSASGGQGGAGGKVTLPAVSSPPSGGPPVNPGPHPGGGAGNPSP